MSSLRLPALLGALIALILLAQPASASRSLRVGLQDDAWLVFGPGTLEERLAKFDRLQVEIVRFNLQWNRIARVKPRVQRDPDDPAYEWDSADAVLRGLREHGIPAVLTIVGAPRWANGGRAPAWAPRKASLFANFAYAAAERYPWVRHWLVWNEPNQRRWLRPTSARVYVQKLLNPGYSAIKQANRRAKVGGGVTAPRGKLGGVSPVDWIRAMRSAGARLDAYAHHPYPLSRFESPTSGACGHCRTLTMASLERLLSEVSRSFGAKRIWLTEYGYQTNPPDRLLGVSFRKQARFIREAARRAYLAPRVDMLVHFLYRDEAVWQSGLEQANGKAKPGMAAFRLAAARY